VVFPDINKTKIEHKLLTFAFLYNISSERSRTMKKHHKHSIKVFHMTHELCISNQLKPDMTTVK